MAINILNLPKIEGLTKKGLEETLLFIFSLLSQKKSINLIFVNQSDIMALNERYRKKKQETDILTFDYGKEADIVICPDFVVRQKSKEESAKEAIEYTFIHGALHAFGYDHEEEGDKIKMVLLENKIKRSLK